MNGTLTVPANAKILVVDDEPAIVDAVRPHSGTRASTSPKPQTDATALRR